MLKNMQTTKFLPPHKANCEVCPVNKLVTNRFLKKQMHCWPVNSNLSSDFIVAQVSQMITFVIQQTKTVQSANNVETAFCSGIIFLTKISLFVLHNVANIQCCINNQRQQMIKPGKLFLWKPLFIFLCISLIVFFIFCGRFRVQSMINHGFLSFIFSFFSIFFSKTSSFRNNFIYVFLMFQDKWCNKSMIYEF